jgi:ERCC4-type nuclease
MTAMKIKEVLGKYKDSLMSISGVVGIGQGLYNDEPCIKVFLIKKTRELEKKIPRELESYKVEFEEIGEVRAY